MADREVPRDLEAERYVLGCCMLSREVIPDVVAAMRAEDFYSPQLGATFAAVGRLYESGQGVDARTVSDALAGTGPTDVELLGMLDVPATSNVGTYAAIVVKHAARRALLRVASEIADQAYGLADPGDIVDQAQTGLATVELPVAHLPDGLSTMSDLMGRPEALHQEWVIPGLLRRDWRVITVSTEGSGKLLDVETPILTSNGWTTMGEIGAGAVVYAPDGTPTTVVACSPVEYEPTWRLTFDDGASLIAGERHLWETVDYWGRQGGQWAKTVRSTAEIAGTLHARGGHTVNHAISCPAPPDLPQRDYLVDPWTLGYWLGNGSTGGGQIHSGGAGEDLDAVYVMDRLEEGGTRLGTVHHDPARHKAVIGTLGLQKRLRELGVLNDKHVPEMYLTGSAADRLALLQGLMDSDGYCGALEGNGRGKGSARCELTFTKKPLAESAFRLVLSMGIKATINESAAKLYGREVSRRWRIGFQTCLPVFGLPRKAAALAAVPLRTRRSTTRYIVRAERVADVPLRCIQVDRPDGMWLAGDHLIPTHNSLLLQQVGLCASQGIHPFHFGAIPPARVLFVDLENPVGRIAQGYRLITPHTTIHARDFDEDRAWIWRRESGINVRTRHDRTDLESVIAAVRPDLVCMGPTYKMSVKAPGEGYEEPAMEVARFLDGLRKRYRFALLMEDHAPQATGGRRDLRPVGSGVWMRWPDIGLSLTPDQGNTKLVLHRFRGDRMENDWPDEVVRGGKGGTWPWVGYWEHGHNDQESF